MPSAKYLTTIDTEFWLPGHNETSAPISTFWQRVRHLSHPEYPFLDPVYSPRSCVPCADFTAFIADRLRNDDVASVCDLVQLVMTECLGIGTGSGWVEQAIKEMYANIGELARLDLSPYCHANNPNFEWELKSMFVMWPREKERRGYLLANGRFSLLSSAMCCYDIHWSKRVSELRERAYTLGGIRPRHDGSERPTADIGSSDTRPKSILTRRTPWREIGLEIRSHRYGDPQGMALNLAPQQNTAA